MLSVGAFQLTCFFAFANLGMQSVPPGRSGVLAYTTMLWMVPLSLLVGEKVGWRGVAGAAARPRRHRRADRSAALRLERPRIVEGHAWLLLAGFTWALAILHTRRHRWRLHAARRAALADVAWRPSCSGSWRSSSSPRGHLDFSQPELWIALIYIGVLAGPTGTWAAVSVARALPPVTGSLGMLGMPLLGIASSVVLVGEPITGRW